ncbi:MAG: hypothetical protein RLZZ46_438 [Bacteroidota bacterium]
MVLMSPTHSLSMVKSKIVLLFLAFLHSVNLFSQGVAPSRFLVRFTDKNGTPFTTTNPASFLSQRAISRRLAQNISVNYSDLPPVPFYIDSLVAKGAQVLNVSRWLNAASIFTTDSSVITAIQNLPFVSGITPVRMPLPGNQGNKFDIYESGVGSRKVFHQVDSFPRSLSYGASYGQISMLNLESIHAQGYLGQGVLIAVLDAGFFNADILPAFDSLFANGQILATRDFVDGGINVFDDHTHGMNVLSVLGGNIPGGLIGSAPAASYLLLRSEDAATEFLIEEFNWVVAAEYADSSGADIISSSLGYTTFDNASMDHAYPDLDGNTALGSLGAAYAARRGILVVNSAGNWGGSAWNYIGVPADADSIIATGAVDSLEILAGFSSRGPSADGRIKPDVSAQGVDVVMSASSGQIMTGNGTSFSCPLVAGAAACLWQANPNLSAMQLRQAIIQSCDQFSTPDNNKGYGVPDFSQALFLLNGKKFTNPGKDLITACYPNPTFSDIHLSLFSSQNQNIRILLCDLSGRCIEEINVEAGDKNYHHFRVQMNDLSSGLYLLRIGFRDSEQILKIVRQ